MLFIVANISILTCLLYLDQELIMPRMRKQNTFFATKQNARKQRQHSIGGKIVMMELK